MDSRKIIAALREAGWVQKRVSGSHHHPNKPGIVTVPHPKTDLPLGTIRSIEKQAGMKLR